VTAPQRRDRRQAAAEARQAAIREQVREDVAAWPPLSPWQRDQLRQLLDLSGEPETVHVRAGGDHDDQR
jgi:hypothetical protein